MNCKDKLQRITEERNSLLKMVQKLKMERNMLIMHNGMEMVQFTKKPTPVKTPRSPPSPLYESAKSKGSANNGYETFNATTLFVKYKGVKKIQKGYLVQYEKNMGPWARSAEEGDLIIFQTGEWIPKSNLRLDFEKPTKSKIRKTGEWSLGKRLKIRVRNNGTDIKEI